MNLCPEKTTVPECIEYYCKINPDALCCSVRKGTDWTMYSRRQFWDLVCRYAELFSSSLPENTLMLFAKRLDIHLLTAYIGAMKAGLIPAQLSPPTSKLSVSEYKRKVDHIYNITKYGAVFTDPDLAINFSNNEKIKIFTSADPLPSEYSDISKPGEDALVQFSSGTTGLQKGVVLSHHAIISHMRNYSEALKLSSSDAIVSWLPLYHDMGLIACYLMPLMCGIPFYQMDPFDWVVRPDILLSTIEDKRPTITFLPNFAYQLLAAKGNNHDLSSIRLWINCSEPARLYSHEIFLSRFPSVKPSTLNVCYALAENTFAVTQTFPWPNKEEHVSDVNGNLSCGKPIPGVEIAIVNSLGNGAGEIGIRSGSLFKHFLDYSLPLTNDYYLTGDLGFINKQGELFITGRKKDMIIVNGKNIFPQDAEFAASQVEGVYPGRTVAFGIWNEEVGSEELFVLAERKGSSTLASLKLAIQKAIQDETGIVPKRVEILEHMSLVKTTSGKISRSRNKELYLEKGLKVL